MNKQIIVPCRLETTFTNIPDTMVFKQSKLAPITNWAASKCAKFLQWVGWLKPDAHELCTFQRYSFDTENIVRFVMEESYKLRGNYNVRELVIVMGAVNFQLLTRQLVKQPFMFQFPPQQTQLGGMMMCILPWVDGVTLVPREYLPIEEKIVEKVVAMTPEMARTEREKLEGQRAADAWNAFMGRKFTEPDYDDEHD